MKELSKKLIELSRESGYSLEEISDRAKELDRGYVTVTVESHGASIITEDFAELVALEVVRKSRLETNFINWDLKMYE